MNPLTALQGLPRRFPRGFRHTEQQSYDEGQREGNQSVSLSRNELERLLDAADARAHRNRQHVNNEEKVNVLRSPVSENKFSQETCTIKKLNSRNQDKGSPDDDCNKKRECNKGRDDDSHDDYGKKYRRKKKRDDSSDDYRHKKKRDDSSDDYRRKKKRDDSSDDYRRKKKRDDS